LDGLFRQTAASANVLLDWNDVGEAFFINTVIGHLWHLVPGAHYQRMFGEDFNPYLFALMGSCSDHKHFAGNDWTKSRGGQGEHGELGGGHFHAGAMIYQGDNWPDEYRHRIMMANIHGNRLLYDELERTGSGYTGRHGKSFLMANDPWFRSVSVSYGPDGGVFASDWNDLGNYAFSPRPPLHLLLCFGWKILRLGPGSRDCVYRCRRASRNPAVWNGVFHSPTPLARVDGLPRSAP